MITCPNCGYKEAPIKTPAKLSKTHEKVLAYCNKPRTSKEIAEHLGCSMTAVYNHLRVMQRLDVLEKQQTSTAGGFNHNCVFVATGRKMAFDPTWMRYTTEVMGVRI